MSMLRRTLATLTLFAAGMWFVHQLDWNPSWGTVFGTMSDVLVTAGIILVAAAVLALIAVGQMAKNVFFRLVSVMLIIAVAVMWSTIITVPVPRILAVLAVFIVFVGLAYLAIKVDIRTAPEWSRAVQAVKARNESRKAKKQAASAAAGTTTGASAPQSA